MLYVGLDAHKTSYAVAILDPETGSVKSFRVRGSSLELLRQLLSRVGDRRWAVCFEASYDYGHLYDRLIRVAERVVVAHPAKLSLIYGDKRKNDRVDAEKLAKLLYADIVPAVYVPEEQVRIWRKLINQRSIQVHKRVRTKNAIRALLRSREISPPGEIKDLWSRRGIAWLQALALPTVEEDLQRDLLLEELRSFDACIDRLSKHLDALGGRNPAVRLLQTIPGVGPRTAEAFVAFVADPARFRRIKQIGAYFGLVPCQDQSGPRNRLGHITREGPAVVRGLLVEAAWWSRRYSKTVRAYYQKRLNETRTNKKIAIVATAHYLARVMLSMLRSGEAWREGEAPAAAVA